jgi:hypothetical protein
VKHITLYENPMLLLTTLTKSIAYALPWVS